MNNENAEHQAAGRGLRPWLAYSHKALIATVSRHGDKRVDCAEVSAGRHCHAQRGYTVYTVETMGATAAAACPAPAISCPATVTTRANRLSRVPYAILLACSRSLATRVLRRAYLGGSTHQHRAFKSPRAQVPARENKAGHAPGACVQLQQWCVSVLAGQFSHLVKQGCDHHLMFQPNDTPRPLRGLQDQATHQKASLSLSSETLTRSNSRGTPAGMCAHASGMSLGDQWLFGPSRT